jgi:ketosteroid isomerase-like protein
MIETERTATEDAIKTVIHDYYEAWWTADPTRMASALHPDLAKRSLMPDGRSGDQDTATSMVDWTARGSGRKHAGDQFVELVVHDLDETMAAVKVRTNVYIEYLHLVRLPEGWKILNVLWRRA